MSDDHLNPGTRPRMPAGSPANRPAAHQPAPHQPASPPGSQPASGWQAESARPTQPGRPPAGNGEPRQVRPWVPALTVLVVLPGLLLLSTWVADRARTTGLVADNHLEPVVDMFRPVGTLEQTETWKFLVSLAAAAVVAAVVTWLMIALSGRRAGLFTTFSGAWSGTIAGLATGGILVNFLYARVVTNEHAREYIVQQLYYGLSRGAAAGLLLGWLIGVVALLAAAVTRRRPAPPA